MKNYMTKEEKETYDLRRKHLKFKRSIFGLKNLFSCLVDITIIRPESEIEKALIKSGLVSSSKEAKGKIKYALINNRVEIAPKIGGMPEDMKFEYVHNVPGNKKIRVHYTKYER